MKFFIPVSFLLFFGCNNAATDQKSGESRADSIKDQVIVAHNVSMGRMEKISRVIPQIKQKLDSISRLTGLAAKKIAVYRAQLESTLNRLQFANGSMEKWMEAFDMDTLGNDPDKRLQYMQSEQVKINAIKDSMQLSLADADLLLKVK